jgi:ABC-2 type transport system ATP-binding protein
MTDVFEARGLTRKYGETIALNEIDVAIPAGSVVGLIGRNGSGKSTLLDLVLGLRLPTSGSCRTFGVETAELGAIQLARIGAVHQENRLLAWMTVEQHLRYVAAFHPQWDRERENTLLEELELGRDELIRKLSPGNSQKLAVVLAVCSRPEFLLLDEPVSAMDPIARERLLTFLLEMVRDDHTTVVVSSHVLRDIERIVDRVLCLEKGRVCADTELDVLLESFGEWVVSSENGGLPTTFDESFVLRQEGDRQRARIVVREGELHRADFERRHNALVERRAVNLEGIFPFLIGVEGER